MRQWTRGAAAGIAAVAVAAALAACTAADAPAPEPSATASTTPSASATPAPSPSAPAEPTPDTTAAPADDAVEGGGTAPDDRTPVEPVITYAGPGEAAGTVEVSGYVPVLESGGRCTVELVDLAPPVVAHQDAEPDASSTTCGTIVLSVPGGAASAGRVVLRYESPASAGASAPTSVSTTR